MNEKNKTTVCLAGNPNVGKSTVFNALTGSNQHTGNWAGKTVTSAKGEFKRNGTVYELIDLPGTFSLDLDIAEEAAAKEYIESGKADCVMVVCDGTNLERSLILAIEVIKREARTVICVNLMDEAEKKGVKIDLKLLSLLTGAEVIGVSAKNGTGLDDVAPAIERAKKHTKKEPWYDDLKTNADSVKKAEDICKKTVQSKPYKKSVFDRILLNKYMSIPVMVLFLCLILWITIKGANYPSELLSGFLFGIEDKIYSFLKFLHLPDVIANCVVYGIYRTLAWVTAVMLPPMAIFFPLFTLLEDLGFLPRIAFDLDNCFKKCRSCGKQALTMCMGIGCNAAAVVGCRIIESPRERLISIITNSFMPCNGRFALLIVIIGTFFAFSSFSSALLLAALIVLGILATFAASYLLSKTLLKGEASTFTLELPPYRVPQIKKVIVRSILDRTIFVLGRAAAVAAPAGLIIWLLSNISVGDASLLSHCTGFLDPFARLFGIDGTIMTAFILGLPANEIVLPIILMSYTGSGVMQTTGTALSEVFAAHGWNCMTAVCVCVICLFHIPCTTTLLTIKKETGSLKYTFLSAVIPMITGLTICFIINSIYLLFC